MSNSKTKAHDGHRELSTPFSKSFTGKLIDKPGLHLPVPTKAVRVQGDAKARAIYGRPVITCPHCNASGEATPNDHWRGYVHEAPVTMSNGLLAGLADQGYRALWYMCGDCSAVSYVAIEPSKRNRKHYTLGGMNLRRMEAGPRWK